MAICPTCHTSVDELITQPNTHTLLQSITPPTDMSSVLSALQQLINNFNLITGNGPGQSGQPGKNGEPGTKSQLGRFTEQRNSRVTKKVKVYSKQDPATFVEVEQINAMTFRDSVTGEVWTWGR